jgi:TusA-related sulfurtransferase
MPRLSHALPEPIAADVRADRRLDTVGLFCPVPIIRTSETVARMRTGEILEVLSDDRVILLDLPAWCRSMGHHYLGARQEGEELHLFVRKNAEPPRGRPGATPAGR